MATPVELPPAIEKAGVPGGRGNVRSAIAVVTVILLSVTITLELTLVYPALTSLSAAFQSTNITWGLSIVTLVGAAICPLAGKLGDAFGKKRVVVVISTICCVGSVVCAIAPTLLIFVIGRGLQGFGLVTLILAWGYIREVLPPRYIAVGLGGTVAGLGLAATAGPFLSAWLLAIGGYQAIFWFLLAYTGVLTLVFLAIGPAGSPERRRRRLDVPSALLIGVGVGLLLLGVTEGPTWGWASMGTILSLVAGLVLVGAAFARMRRVDEPLIDLALLVGPKLRTTVALLFIGNFIPTGLSISLPLMTQTAPQEGITYGLGASPLEFALLLLPYGLLGMICGPLGGYLAKTTNPRTVARVGMALFVLTPILLIFMHTHLWQLILVTCGFGLAFGLLFSAFPILVSQAVPAEDMAATSGVVNSVSGLAGSVASVLVGVVLAGAVLRIDPTTSAAVYTTGGFVTVLVILAALAVVGLVVTLVMRHGSEAADGAEMAAAPAH